MANEKIATVVWQGKMAFAASGSTAPQFTIPLDADEAVGGENNGYRPLELLAIGLAGCTAMDVISILRKKKQDVTAFETEARVTQGSEHPKVFNRITLTFRVTGHNVNPRAVARAIELSETKYCPASAMLGQTAEIVTQHEIIEAEPGA